MDYKSHTKRAIKEAQSTGGTVWYLDTGSDGEDDVLISNTYDEVLADVLHHHELDNLPDHWMIVQVEI